MAQKISSGTLNTKRSKKEVEITPEKIKKILKKAPGPDCVQGFWLKNFW